jgi:hypothetical protein
MPYYIALTSDLKTTAYATMKTQLSSSGTFHITDDFYNDSAAALLTTATKLKADDALAFSTPTGTPNGNLWSPLGAFVMVDNIRSAFIHTDPRPYPWTTGGIRLFTAEPAAGAKTKPYYDATVKVTTMLCSGVRIISEVPLADYIGILRKWYPNWPVLEPRLY